MNRKHEEYTSALLKPFADKLQSGYYDEIGLLCQQINKQSKKIKDIEKAGSQMQYVLQCDAIIAEIEKYIQDRKNIYMPYVHSLSEKVDSNHNCSSCAGSCKVNHNVHLIELDFTNKEMQKVLSRLQVMCLPLYAETLYPDEYRLLRSAMTLLETSITELFFLENNYLIPKIAEAQKSINAYGK